MDHGIAVLSDPSFDLSAIGNPRWDQWYREGEPSYNDLLAANGGNQQHEVDEMGFIHDFTIDPPTTQWAESLTTQDSLPVRHDSQSTNRDSFSGSSEYQLRSSPIETKPKRRRSSRKKDDTVRSPREDITINKHRETAPIAIPVNTHTHGTTNEATSLSSENSSYTSKVRERNRRAANKVRYRQREAEKSLESTEKGMDKVHRDLTASVQELNHEVQCLKLQPLQHVGCDCALIQEYIACEANRYIKDISKERTVKR
ncbi:hypothetical protein ACHAPQ_010001 [Fusarium lateritium]